MSAYMVDKSHVDALVRVALEGPQDASRPTNGGGPVEPWSFSWAVRDESERWGYRHHRLVRMDGLRSRDGDITPDELGALLIAENRRSIEARYPDTLEDWSNAPGPIVQDYQDAYEYDGESVPRLTIAQAMKACDGYSYQACETGDAWRTSDAHAVIDALRDALIGVLPGYDAASSWSVTVDKYDELIGQGAGAPRLGFLDALHGH